MLFLYLLKKWMKKKKKLKWSVPSTLTWINGHQTNNLKQTIYKHFVIQYHIRPPYLYIDSVLEVIWNLPLLEDKYFWSNYAIVIGRWHISTRPFNWNFILNERVKRKNKPICLNARNEHFNVHKKEDINRFYFNCYLFLSCSFHLFSLCLGLFQTT